MTRAFSWGIVALAGAGFAACEAGSDEPSLSTSDEGTSSSGGSSDGGPGGGENDGKGSGGAVGMGGAECNPDDFTGPAAILACKTDCDPKGPDDSSTSVCIQRVEGRLIDEEGEPITQLGVSICGEVCYGGASDDEGNFSIPVFAWYEPEEYSIGPHGSPHLSSFYHQLDADFPGGETYQGGDIRLLQLPEDGPLLIDKLELDDDEQSPEQTVTNGSVTLKIGAGTIVALTIGDALEGEEGHRFRALELKKSLHEEYAPQFGADARLFVLGPFDAAFEAGEGQEEISVTLEVANTEGWNPGASVEVFALGTYYDEEWIPPHTFAAIGTAVVSEDGSIVELAPDAAGARLRHLTWIALRPTE